MTSTNELAFQVVADQFITQQGHIVVTGGAGCGKTTLALRKAAAWAANNSAFAHSSALFLSFANATIQRVAEHARQWVPEEDRKRLTVNTYHGFAWSVLRSHGYLLGSPRALTLMTPGEQNAFTTGLASDQDVDEAHRELFLKQGSVAFDYFADYAAEILESFPLIASAYANSFPVIFLDEFQDTSDAQWRMVRTLLGHSALVALGDPDQRIYQSFRGASATRFSEFEDLLAPVKIDLSAWNWRSPEGSIVQFGRDILAGTVAESYAAVELVGTRFPPLSYLKWMTIAGLKRQRAKNGTIAILTPSNALSVRVYDYFLEAQSQALPALHLDIHADRDEALAGTIFIATLLEACDDSDLAVGAACRAMARYLTTRSDKLGAGARKKIFVLESAAHALETGTAFRELVLISRIRTMVEAHQSRARSGHPYADFLTSVSIAAESADNDVERAGKGTRVVSILSRGSEVEAAFADSWRESRSYRDAGKLMRNAIAQYQLMNAKTGTKNLVVMNVHRAKGKEFDEVFVYEETHTRFLHSDRELDSARKTLNVAVTRAREKVTVLTPYNAPSVLVS